ncbi:MAG: hypothetical protein F6K09_03765 [Merismopedia sp. SIO2A8]|nr:hypothetical protein [Merismopedia sp. SIO2A8]
MTDGKITGEKIVNGTNPQQSTVDCKTACLNGCVLGDDCPNDAYRADASSFIQNTSLDDMHAIAEEALRKKIAASSQEASGPKWVFPEGGIQP